MKTKIFLSFFKVGLFTFGGGYAMLPIVIAEVVHKRQWFSEQEVMECYTIAQLSMGIIAINTAALLVAQRYSKTLAVLAAVATMLPSILILTLVSLVLPLLPPNEAYAMILLSLQIGVAVLIAVTWISLVQATVWSKRSVIVCVGVVLLMVGLQLSPLVVVSLAVALSIGWGLS